MSTPRILLRAKGHTDVEIRMKPIGKGAITFDASGCTRSDSRKPWDKDSIDYLSTSGCMATYGKVRNGGLVRGRTGWQVCRVNAKNAHVD